MKTCIQKFIIAAFMVSTMSPMIAAPKTKKDQPAKTTIANGWNWKTKALTTLGVISAGVVAFVVWKSKSGNGASDLDKLFEMTKQNNPQSVPTGRAGQLFSYSTAHSENFQTAMKNPVSADNIQALFAHEQFIQLMNNPRAQIVQERLQAAFNEPDIIRMSQYDDFVKRMLATVQNIMPN